MSNFNQSIVTECLHELRAALLMQRANESAMNLAGLSENNSDKCREIIAECKDKAKVMIDKVQHQINHLKQDLLDVQKEIEILGGGDFAELIKQQNEIENQIFNTQKELQHAIAI